MVGFLIMGVFAAFGCICALWALISGLFPSGSGAVVCPCHPGLKEMAALRRFLWLRDWGFLKCPIILLDCGITQEERQQLSALPGTIVLCLPEELPARLELERNEFDRTGNGDHPGRGQRRGVSEL